MDIPSLLYLETRPTIKHLLLKNRKRHTNDIFIDWKKYEEFPTLFHQFLKNDDNFFVDMRMAKLTFYYILENVSNILSSQMTDKNKRN